MAILTKLGRANFWPCLSELSLSEAVIKAIWPPYHSGQFDCPIYLADEPVAQKDTVQRASSLHTLEAASATEVNGCATDTC